MRSGLPPFYSDDKSKMYTKILNDDLIFPHDMSDDACDLLLGLLEKDPENRMSPLEIQDHLWFKGFDWEALIQKRLKPPWKPGVKGPMDMSQIDPDLLKETPFDTPDVLFPVDFIKGDEDLFEGFTFEGVEVTTAMTGSMSNVDL